MLDSLTNYFWSHPIAMVGLAVAIIIVLIWMTGSGSRQRFISFKRTKETDQLARDLSRIAAALERIARSGETPMDYVGRPIPHGWEENISAGEPSEDVPSYENAVAASENGEHGVPVGVSADHAEVPAAAPHPVPTAPRQSVTDRPANPLGRTADLLGGKKKLDLPNPLYRPK
ncbi:MAG TPA: hypothetical protein VKB26_01800 [Candidatus Acidoferrales bacterium]|nr:hypothetical protein [Candidatus Acidoferrales bacterium]